MTSKQPVLNMTDFGLCDHCGREFPRYEYDELAADFGHDPIIDHLKGQKGRILCPSCQD